MCQLGRQSEFDQPSRGYSGEVRQAGVGAYLAGAQNRPKLAFLGLQLKTGQNWPFLGLQVPEYLGWVPRPFGHVPPGGQNRRPWGAQVAHPPWGGVGTVLKFSPVRGLNNSEVCTSTNNSFGRPKQTIPPWEGVKPGVGPANQMPTHKQAIDNN